MQTLEKLKEALWKYKTTHFPVGIKVRDDVWPDHEFAIVCEHDKEWDDPAQLRACIQQAGVLPKYYALSIFDAKKIV